APLTDPAHDAEYRRALALAVDLRHPFAGPVGARMLAHHGADDAIAEIPWIAPHLLQQDVRQQAGNLDGIQVIPVRKLPALLLALPILQHGTNDVGMELRRADKLYAVEFPHSTIITSVKKEGCKNPNC